MRMRSTASSDKNELLFEILTVTVGFLDEKLNESFARSNSIDFDKVSLSAVSYEIAEVNDGYTASLTLTGRAFFADGTSPSQQDITDLTAEIFQAGNHEYLESLIFSDDLFLQGVQYAVVKVNGNVVSENRGQASVENNIIGFDSWIILAVAGLIGFMVVLLTCLLWYCCSSINYDDEEEEAKHVRKTPSKATRKTIGDDESFNEGSRSPSPARSISSQDSSVFTYNPNSAKSTDSKTFGSFLTSNTGTEMDVEAWQKGSRVHKDTTIFGHDISAIESKKDLSLIEEGSDEENTPDKRRPGASYLSKYPQSYLQAPERSTSGGVGRPSFSSHSTTSRRSSFSSSSTSSVRGNKKKSIDLEADAEELINDLKDLSLQINRYRNG